MMPDQNAVYQNHKERSVISRKVDMLDSTDECFQVRQSDRVCAKVHPAGGRKSFRHARSGVSRPLAGGQRTDLEPSCTDLTNTL
eukprot:9455161-Alexandrium_andersonii.AAC.1